MSDTPQGTSMEGATARPAGWLFELAGAINISGEYCSWGAPQFSFSEPCVPVGSIRNLTPLYAVIDIPPKDMAELAAAIKAQASRNALLAEAASVLDGIKWRSADKDNMEFSATITCFQMDAIGELAARIRAQAEGMDR